MTDESILQTHILDEMPSDHRPDDEWIAAKLRVDHEFKKRMAAGVQRKFKRNFQGGMGTGYTTSDEVWCHYKPTEEQLEKWINQEDRGEKRIDEQSAMKGDGGDSVDDSMSTSAVDREDQTTLSDVDDGGLSDDTKRATASHNNGHIQRGEQRISSTMAEDMNGGDSGGIKPTDASADAAGDASEEAPQESWLGMLPALRDGPQQT